MDTFPEVEVVAEFKGVVWVPSQFCTCPWRYCGETDSNNNPPSPCSFGFSPIKAESVKRAEPTDPSSSDSYISTDPESGAQKEVKLERFDLIPVFPLFELARHYGRGAKKYAENQWRGGYSWWKSFRAAMTHLLQFWAGEDIDKETGSPHLICVVWHCFTLMEYGRTCPEKDTRVKQPYAPSTMYDGTPGPKWSWPTFKYRVTVEGVDQPEYRLVNITEANGRIDAIEKTFRVWVGLYDSDSRLISCDPVPFLKE